MENNIFNSLNKGIPISTPIVLSSEELDKITYNKNNMHDTIQKSVCETNKKIAKICGISDPNYIPMIGNLAILSNPDTLEKNFYISINDLYCCIKDWLAFFDKDFFKTNDDTAEDYVNNVKTDFTNKEINKRLNEIKNIKDEETLKRKYPRLYRDYLQFHEANKVLLSCVNQLRNLQLRPQTVAKYKKVIMYGQNSDRSLSDRILEIVNFSVSKYCQEKAKLMENMIEHYDDIYKCIIENPINLNNSSINKEKFELYITMKSMNYCINEKSDMKQRYIHYVYNYFKENESRKTSDSPKIRYSDFDVTPKVLYEIFSNFLKDKPKIRLINLDEMDVSTLNLGEFEEFVANYLKDLSVPFKIIPDDTYDIMLDYTPSASKKEKKENTNDDKVSEEKLLEIFMKKKEFFGSRKTVIRVKGEDEFEGYIGYVYINGKVVLEKYYNSEKTKSLTYGNAIYCMDADKFLILSQFPKRILKNNPNVDRIEHRDDWQDKVSKIINMDNSVKALVKKV